MNESNPEQKIEFYCIKVITPNGDRGFIYDSPEGIQIVMGGFHSSITQFKSKTAAKVFINKRKIETRGIKAYIKSNIEILEDFSRVETSGISKIIFPLFYIENEDGKKCFFDSSNSTYYFKEMGDAGFPVWEDENHITKFVSSMLFNEKKIFIVKMDGRKKFKKLILAFDDRIQSPLNKLVFVENQEWIEY